MKSSPASPGRTWLERLSLTLALALVSLGAISLLGWFLGIEEVLQPLPNTAPVSANAALAFVLLGGVLLALDRGARAVALLALGPAAIGGLTLLEHLRGIDLKIDELLVVDRLAAGAATPGRMPLVVAASLLLCGLALAWRVTDGAARTRLFVEGLIGSALVSMGFAALVGYAAGLDAVYKWSAETAIGPASGTALLVLGLAMLILAWRETMQRDGEAPAWSPMPAVVACLTLTVILSVGLRDRERAYLHQKTQSATEALATRIKLELEQRTNRLERLARSRSESRDNSPQTWEAEARKQFDESVASGGVSLAYLGTDGHALWSYPEGAQPGMAPANVPDPVRSAALTRAGRPPFDTVISSSVDIARPGGSGRVSRGAVFYAPVLREGAAVGFIAAEYLYETFFAAICRAVPRLSADYRLVISVGSEKIYSTSMDGAVPDDELTFEKTYPIEDRRLVLALTPAQTLVEQDRHYLLPNLAFGAGLGIALLLGLSVHLARSARAGQRAAESSNKKLFAENEERRRIEGRLKVSDERLRLALDSTQIGISEWSVPSGHVYYSPGLWAMLGYDHARMPSTVEAWQSLIHPDDIAVFRRRTDSQLSGVATFIELEYRVSARSGDWRWVYTRSKTVAAGPDGRPTRIIGTVQDITARREAELALRESQAEARKLSLVASKTDNPVLIGSPDGRIEWANEAFCRVMEYALEEVVGKNPAHFMVGPETNPRTVARIRAAMARGQGISTDVVNYSKSGRRYHLHLEIQPVRGAGGAIENFIAVETDITGRVETERQLRRAKAEADDASRAKSEFLASMSHEIRTPMNGVIGMTSLLMDTALAPEQRDFVNTIRASGEALLTIINDILDFSKIESGKMELERTPFELALCLEEALDLFALQASAKKLELGYRIASNVPAWILGDVTRLRQVVVNLVNNAVKFTPGGSISLEVRRIVREPLPLEPGESTPADSAQMTLEFTVRDTGIGIPDERVDRLFKPFSQVDSSTTRKYGGTGLGLAICQRLTQLMGGDIRAESNVGQGSTFVFTIQTEAASGASESTLPPLPEALREGLVMCVEDHAVTGSRLQALFECWGARCMVEPDLTSARYAIARLPQPPALLVVEGNELVGRSPLEALANVNCPRLLLFPFGQTLPTSTLDGLPFATATKPIRTSAFIQSVCTLFQSAAVGAAAAKTPERPLAEEIPLEVLVAEDNSVNQKVALRFLERLGYRADTVANGLEAVTAVENRRYDLVLMDLQMPEMDGFEATRQIRARLPAHRQPKIVALTANAMQGDRELCAAAGMDDHVSKPVKIHEIAAAIRKHCRKSAPA
ncbi:MAG: ATP-binding protein [Opitutaceae bacterium]